MNWTVNWFPQFPISLSAPRHPTQPLSLYLYPPFFQIFFRRWKLGSVNFLYPTLQFLFWFGFLFICCFFWPVTIKPKPISPLVFQEDHHSVSVSSLPLFSLKTPSFYSTLHLFLFFYYYYLLNFPRSVFLVVPPIGIFVSWSHIWFWAAQTKVPPSTTPLSIMQEIKVRFWFWSPWNSSWDSFDGFTFVYSLSEV